MRAGEQGDKKERERRSRNGGEQRQREGRIKEDKKIGIDKGKRQYLQYMKGMTK